MEEHTPYQRQVIRRYYARQPAILHQRLAEMVSELYLAEGKQRERLWATVKGALEKLEVPQSRIEHLLKKADPALLAGLLQELDQPSPKPSTRHQERT
ncbi:MAG: hypothetical protein HY000_33195 [Planctomycetes bacterium]|nr:hypothetical protein [Planctomycetota bacterium]